MKNSSEPKYLSSFILKMKKEGIHPIVIDTFVYYYEKVVAGEKVLKDLVMIILNGGLGTTMGLTRSKSLIKASMP